MALFHDPVLVNSRQIELKFIILREKILFLYKKFRDGFHQLSAEVIEITSCWSSLINLSFDLPPAASSVANIFIRVSIKLGS